MSHTTRRTVLYGLGTSLALAAVPSAPALAGAAGHGRDHHRQVAVPGSSPRDRAWARRVLRRMSLEQKVGQVFTAHVYGSAAGAASDADAAQNLQLYGVRTPAEVVQKFNLGGVLYFAWANNTQDPAQIAGLSNGLQRAALCHGAHVPLTICIDQEQGIVNRVLAPATQFPGAMALGATRSQRDARLMGRVTGQELRAMGVTMDFAPDADVNINPANPVIGVRSPGGDPDLVSRIVVGEVEGLQESVSACAKHFPGHGDTATDSHFGLPLITHSLAQWRSTDRPPFAAAIEAGVDAVMTAHLLVPALDDSGDPATLSRPIVTGVLRGDLGFDGLVVTDGLGMAGVRQKYGDDEVAVRALLAGVDVLLDSPDVPKAWNAVLAAVRSGRIPMSRLDEAVERNLQVKAARGVVDEPLVDVAAVATVVGSPRHQRIAARVADDSTTLLRNTGVLPLQPRGLKVALVGWSSGTASHEVIRAALVARGATVTVTTTGTAPTAAQHDAAIAAATAADVVLVTSYNATPGSAQAKLVADLRATGRPVVVAALRNPYDIAAFPEVDAYLATYSWVATGLEAMVRVLVGEHNPTGTLPVAVPAADGSVLYPFGAGIGL